MLHLKCCSQNYAWGRPGHSSEVIVCTCSCLQDCSGIGLGLGGCCGGGLGGEGGEVQ